MTKHRSASRRGNPVDAKLFLGDQRIAGVLREFIGKGFVLEKETRPYINPQGTIMVRLVLRSRPTRASVVFVTPLWGPLRESLLNAIFDSVSAEDHARA